MTELSIIFALLLIAALSLLLLPLAKQFEENKKPLFGIALFVPLFSMAFYFWIGTPEFAEISSQKAKADTVTLVDKLEAKLQKNPKDVNGWLLLGRSYLVTEEHEKSVNAFEKAYQLEPNNLNTLLPLVDAIAVSQNGKLLGRPYQLLLKAYKLDTQNQMTLWLLGMAEKQQNRPESAAEHWLTLYQLLPPDSADKPKVAKLLASIGKTVQTPTTKQQTEQADKNVARFTMDETLKHQYPKATVFIYAKATSGMPMPIAAEKHLLKNLPKTIVLDQDDQLMPSRKIVSHQEVAVGFKISLGSATGAKELEKQEQIVRSTGQGKVIIKF